MTHMSTYYVAPTTKQRELASVVGTARKQQNVDAIWNVEKAEAQAQMQALRTPTVPDTQEETMLGADARAPPQLLPVKSKAPAPSVREEP